ncbi:MAG: phenylalanine--tRNA ligase beta subunit-related protein [Nitrososphaerales archaeon]
MEIQKELADSFPGLRVLELRMEGLSVGSTDPALERLKEGVQARIRATTASLSEVKDLQVFRAYRDFFWRVGVDPTKTRPAGEALIRRILAGGSLPTINTFVDAYNLASAETHVAIAAFDLSRVDATSLLMRRATLGEPFRGIGMPAPIVLKGAEVVIEDRSARRLIAVYPYRDSDDSKVTEESRDVLLMMCGVPGLDERVLERAKAVCQDYVERVCRRAGVATG